MNAAARFMQSGFCAVDIRARITYPIANNTRHASPRCAPGGFLVYGVGNGVQ